MALSAIAGAYTVQYDGATIGETSGGVTIEKIEFKQLVTGDNYGLSPQDAVYQGAECFMQFTCIEAQNVKLRLAMWPYAATFGQLGTVGVLDSSKAKTVLLTNTAGTPAQGEPTTVTAHLAILAEGYPLAWLYAAALRDVPLRFRLYPSSANSNAFFTET